jgi:hypothetical protein
VLAAGTVPPPGRAAARSSTSRSAAGADRLGGDHSTGPVDDDGERGDDHVVALEQLRLPDVDTDRQIDRRAVGAAPAYSTRSGTPPGPARPASSSASAQVGPPSLT